VNEGDTNIMKKRTALFATLFAVTALIAVPLVYAGPGGHGRHGLGFFSHLGQIKEELGLTDQQADQIKSIFRDLHEQNEQYRDELRGGFHAAAEALLKNPNDLSGAQALLDEQAAAEKALRANMLVATSKALNVLTREQRAKLSQLVAEHAAKRAARRERFRR
jgi:Spy/CpxP family protein refolding chaperone